MVVNVDGELDGTYDHSGDKPQGTLGRSLLECW